MLNKQNTPAEIINKLLNSTLTTGLRMNFISQRNNRAIYNTVPTSYLFIQSTKWLG